MKNWLEKQFRLSEFHTDVKTEILAGLTTFVTMAYILATVPNIMSGAGFDKHVTLTIMILLIIVTTCAMALCIPTVRLHWHRDLEAWVLLRL